MTDTTTATTWKELLKDPLVYIIAVLVTSGAYLIKGEQLGATWFVGLGLVSFGVVAFIVRFISALLDGAFKKRYDYLIVAQQGVVRDMKLVIRDLSKANISASQTLSETKKLPGGYERDLGNITQTGGNKPSL